MALHVTQIQKARHSPDAPVALTLPNGQQAISLAGIAEADETYFLESLSLTGIMEPPMIGVMEPV